MHPATFTQLAGLAQTAVLQAPNALVFALNRLTDDLAKAVAQHDVEFEFADDHEAWHRGWLAQQRIRDLQAAKGWVESQLPVQTAEQVELFA